MATINGYQSWVTHNRDVIRNALRLFVAEKERELIIKLKEVADAMLSYIEGHRDSTIPVFTSNLHDATGIAIYVNGRTEYFVMPPKRATKKQVTGSLWGSRRYIDGHEFLTLSIQEGATKFNTGVWIVLYSAVPYAAMIDTNGSKWGRGKDFFKMTKDELIALINSRLKPMSSIMSFNV